jgi:hypothetical protein
LLRPKIVLLEFKIAHSPLVGTLHPIPILEQIVAAWLQFAMLELSDLYTARLLIKTILGETHPDTLNWQLLLQVKLPELNPKEEHIL